MTKITVGDVIKWPVYIVVIRVLKIIQVVVSSEGPAGAGGFAAL